MKTIVMVFLLLSFFSCTRKKIHVANQSDNQKNSVEIELSEKVLAPLVTTNEVFSLCKANSLCHYSKISQEWEIKDYVFFEKGSFFLHKNYIYDYSSSTVRLKVSPDKIYGTKDWSDPKSSFILHGKK